MAIVQEKASRGPIPTPGSPSAVLGTSSGPIRRARGNADSNAATSGETALGAVPAPKIGSGSRPVPGSGTAGDWPVGPTTSTVLICWVVDDSSSYGSQKMSLVTWPDSPTDRPVALASTGGEPAACAELSHAPAVPDNPASERAAWAASASATGSVPINSGVPAARCSARVRAGFTKNSEDG